MKVSKKTISDAQSEMANALRHLANFAAELPDVLRPLVKLAPPKGARARVSFRHSRTDRQVKRNAPADSWSPGSCSVSISYDDGSPFEETGAEEIEASEAKSPDVLQATPTEDRERGVLLALAKAEEDPQLGFVALKWFRDTYLTRQGYSWAATPEHRQRTLEDAIGKNWILTSKVPNPKNPQYPVTAVRVNRPLAEVRRILDQQAGFGSTFAPITVPGELFSETILRERR